MAPDPYLSDLMKLYGFSMVGVRKPGGSRSAGGPNDGARGAASFDAVGRWREVTYQMRRDIVCEACGHLFGYAFVVTADGTISRGQRTLDASMLTPMLERELRRRIKCPRCESRQRSVRRTFVRREAFHSLVGVTALGGTIMGAVGLTSGGYILAGGWGLYAGLALSLVLALVLTRWMLGELIDAVPMK